MEWLKAKGTIFPFLYHHIIIFSETKLKKNMIITVLDNLWFLEYQCLLSMWWKFWFECVASWSCRHPFNLDVTCLPCPCIESHWTPIHYGSTGILYSQASRMFYGSGAAWNEEDTHVVCFSSVHLHAPSSHRTSLTKHIFNPNIINNFKMTTAKH